MAKRHVIYECGICSCYHPWNFNGDCRDDDNRFATPEDYAEAKNLNEDEYFNLEVRSMDDRVAADNGEYEDEAME